MPGLCSETESLPRRAARLARQPPELLKTAPETASKQEAISNIGRFSATCYCSALGLFLFAAWGLWQQAQPHNPFRGKPWIPWLSLILSGFCASFPVFLTKVNISGGSSVTVGVSNDLTSYTSAASTSNFLGATPGDTMLNIVTIFQGFFQAFGAMTCFFAMMA